MSERKLATIRTIAEVHPIPGADLICAYKVDGWMIVDQVNKYQVGDNVIYYEIDSLLPVTEQFEFLRRSSYVKKEWLVSEENPEGEGFRLKTIRLRGQVSQGLLTLVPETITEIEDGLDVSDLLGIVKWDPPVPAALSGKARGNFPSFIPKTDQERVQNLKDRHFENHFNDDFEVTTKIEGSSCTIYHRDGYVGLCSRNLELDWQNDNSSAFAQAMEKTRLATIIGQLGNYAIQSELMGPGVQGNWENLKDYRLFVFDIYDINESRYLSAIERVEMVERIREIQQEMIAEGQVVTLLDHCPVHDQIKACQLTTSELLDMADGPSLNANLREGLVFKSVQNPEFSFKAISNKYLLKTGG